MAKSVIIYGVEIKTPEDIKNASNETLFYLDKAMQKCKSDFGLPDDVIQTLSEEWVLRGM